MKKIIFLFLTFFAVSFAFAAGPQAKVADAQERLASYKQNNMSLSIDEILFNLKCTEYNTKLYQLQGQIFTVKNSFDRIKDRIYTTKKTSDTEINQLKELKDEYDNLVNEYEKLVNEYDQFVKSRN
jgi:archaellum component FlaC